MTKYEAAQFLGVSERAVNRYAARGLLKPTYDKGPRGSMRAVYNAEEVKRLKDSQGRPPEAIKRGGKPSMALDIVKPGALRALLEEITANLAKASPPASPVSFHERLTLTLDDAALWSGLPRDFLRKAVKAGKLKAIKVGRGEWRVKRGVLKAWIKKL